VDALLNLGISEDLILDHMSKDDSASVEAIDSLRRYINKTSGAL
jgi:hypothetical protein